VLRKHQKEMIRAIDGIIAGSPIKNIIVKATPGSGKSSLPIIAGKLITAGHADAICWICPRMSLQDQGERNFIDPFFRHLFKHDLIIRSSTNEVNPCRSTSGWISTYQALGVDKYQTALADFMQKRYILVLDEYHHSEAEDGEWTKALIPLYEKAAYRVLMTGTLMRGDKKRIAFTPYDDRGMPILQGDNETAVIEYSRLDALKDRAIIPLSFIYLGGKSKWKTETGYEAESRLSTEDKKKSGHALYTAINTEYARELMDAAVAHWQKYKQETGHRSKLLVVSARIENAKQYQKYLKSLGLNSQIATSEDGPQAAATIKEFKSRRLDILVSVSMAYEGLDCPPVSHIACLTNIRSQSWIEQMAARAVRIDFDAGPYEKQRAFVFVPDDKNMVQVVKNIENDQIIAARGGNGNGNGNGGETDLFGNPIGITPLSSMVLGRKEVPICNTAPELTSSEIEADLLDQIDDHLKGFAFDNRYDIRKLNSQVFDFFGKPRRQMTIGELRNCLAHVKSVYPRNQIRGTGHKRVPSKAQPIQVTWK